MKVRSLKVQQFYGVGNTEPPVVLEDLGDVNIIYGPNGIGKTVTTRALGAIFWPDSEKAARPYIRAEVEEDNECWLIDVEGGHYTSTPPNPPVDLPEGERSRYFLSLHDLLRAEDSELAKVIQEELQGGSLEEAVTKLDFKRQEPGTHSSERREYNEAIKHIREVEQKQSALHEQENNLQQLRDKLAQAEIARRKLDVYILLEKDRAVLAELEACRQIEEQYLADYPGIKDYQANDLDNYSHARIGRREATARQTTALAEANLARERQQELFPAGQQPPSTADMAEWTARIASWTSLEQRRGERDAARQIALDAEREALIDIQREEEAVRLLQAQKAVAPATLDAETLMLLDGQVESLRLTQSLLTNLLPRRQQNDDSLAAAEAHLQEVEQALQHALNEENKSLARWGGRPPAAGEIAAIEQQLHDIKRTADRLNDASTARDTAAHKLTESRRILEATLTDEQLAAIDRQISTAGLDHFIEKNSELQAGERLLSLLSGMIHEADSAGQEWLRNAVRILEDWLGTAPVSRCELPKWWLPAYWGAAILLTAVAAWGCLRSPEATLPVLGAIAAFIVLIIAGVMLPKMLAPGGEGNLQEQEAKYQQLGTPPAGINQLKNWERAAVQVRLAEYHDKLAELSGQALFTRELAIHRRHHEDDIAGVREDLHRLRNEITAQLGLAGPENAASLSLLTLQLAAWQQARAESIVADNAQRESAARLQEQLTGLGSVFAGWGYQVKPTTSGEAVQTFAEVQAALTDLANKISVTSNARTEAEHARTSMTNARRAVEFDEGQRIELAKRCQNHVETLRGRMKGYLNEHLEEENAEKLVAILHQRRNALDVFQRQIDEKEQSLRASRQLRERQQASAETLTAELTTIDAGIAEIRDLLTTAFAAFGEVEVNTFEEAAGRLQSLRERKVAYEQAAQTILDREQTAREAASAVAGFQGTLEEIINRLGLHSIDDEETQTRNEEQLRIFNNSAPAYARAREERVIAATRREQTRLALERCEGYDPEVDTCSPAELQQAKTTAAGEADNIDKLLHSINQTEFEVDSFRHRRELENALAHAEATKEKLIKLRDEIIRKNTGDVLAEWLRGEIEQNSCEVLQHARTLFSEITAGCYELKVSYTGDGPTFEAIDSRDRKAPRTLEMLSSATRIQLLIAVRLAFLEVREVHSARLPLVMDEVLGNSDDKRAEVVVDSILQAISAPERRRQLFYFTGQADEVAKWQGRERAIKASAPAASLCWKYKFIGSECPPPGQVPLIIDLLPEIEIPAPAPGMSYAAYGRELNIRPFNPAGAANAAHLWYVFSQPEELYQALLRRISTIGQIERLLSDGDSRLFSRLGISKRDDFIAEVRESISIIRCLCDIWRDYHGNPVTREILDASQIVTAAYYDSVVAKALQFKWDSTRFLSGLCNIPRIRPERIENLRTYLEEQGCLPLRTETLTAEMIHVEINSRLGNFEVIPSATVVDTMLARVGILAVCQEKEDLSQPGESAGECDGDRT